MNDLKRLLLLPIDIIIAVIGIVNLVISSFGGLFHVAALMLMKFRMKMIGMDVDEEENENE